MLDKIKILWYINIVLLFFGGIYDRFLVWIGELVGVVDA